MGGLEYVGDGLIVDMGEYDGGVDGIAKAGLFAS